MIFERIKTEGTAHYSYFIANSGEAAVIDPRRDIGIYLELSRRYEVNIKYVLETHRNEDYVAGSLEIKQFYPAEIWHGPGLDWKYGNVIKEGQDFQLGQIRINALLTPGHTDESVSYVLTDTGSGETPAMVFTGDTLFVDDTGRIDLYGTKEASRLAGNLWDSLHKKLLPLGDGVIICPGHGSGSFCGTHIGGRDESTLGTEKLQNPALQFKTRDVFVKYKLAEKIERPHYFTYMEKLNLAGPPVLGKLPAPPPLTTAEYQRMMEKGAVSVDTRIPVSFGGLHIPNSYNIWLEGLSVFSGWVLAPDQPILLTVEEPGQVERAVRALTRSGYDHLAGYLRGGIEAWHNAGFATEATYQLSVQELRHKLENKEPLTVLDVRDDAEWQNGHIRDAIHIYVGHLESRLNEVPRDRPIAVFCNVGYRASLGASILQRAGFIRVSNVPGSFQAWKAAGYPLVFGVD
ncbi:MAG: MBL fold metallo-hydrolase [Dehalococcoidales bacterium]|nr:MBL fold metallo-hydrolase [Dehalococcoidales bacterium]